MVVGGCIAAEVVVVVDGIVERAMVVVVVIQPVVIDIEYQFQE